LDTVWVGWPPWAGFHETEMVIGSSPPVAADDDEETV
jgi:hypothetical protein